MNLKFTFFIFSIFTLLNCTGKEDKQESKIIDKTTGFYMSVPISFPKLDSGEKEGELERGKKQLNKLHDSELDFDENSIETANIFQHDSNNLFIFNTKKYDVKTQGNYREGISDLNKLLYQTQTLNFPKAELDSITVKEKIDGFEFIKYILNAKISENRTLHVINYYYLFRDNKDFTASIIFDNEELGKEILYAFKAAKFKKVVK
jgi:hypothetical protein